VILKINDRIRNRKVEKFNSFNVSQRFDSVGGTFSFSFYFEPNDNELKELLCIGHYHICTLEFNNEMVLKGNIISQSFGSQSARSYVNLAGYSLPGVLEDSNIPTSVYPLQSDGLTIRQIVSKLLQPFGIKFKVDNVVAARMNTVLSTATASESATVKGYISSLCAQQNIIITNTPEGELLFTQIDTTKKPILNFDTTKGLSQPATSFKLSFDGQAMHSHITVMKQADIDGGNAGQHTIRNPYVINSVFRPKTIIQTSGTDTDSSKVARQALANELKGLKLIIEVNTWVVDGKLLRTGEFITVINPDIYLYKKSTWFIEGIDFSGDNKRNVATLTCVLPEVYSQKVPEYLFKGINLH
jgi:prophage tail gpP-like protein